MRALKTGGAVASAVAAVALLIILGVLGRAEPQPTAASANQPESSSLAATPDPPAPQPSPDLLDPVESTAPSWPTSEAIAAAVEPYLEALGPHTGLAVAGNGRLLYGRDAEASFIPASTTKLLTAAAALTTLDPEGRFETAVVRGPAENEIILVGGGDPLLAGDPPPAGYPPVASLADLADQTARALPPAADVTLRYDASLFTGPAMATGWRDAYLGPGTAAIAPVSALIVDHGRVGAPEDRIRVRDPAVAAARRFADLLAERGVTASVAGPGQASGGARLATVVSPPISAVVEVMLTDSDNDVAEALGRHIAIARGEPATFAGAAGAITAATAELGIGTTALHLEDASGLSRSNRITPHTLVDLLTLAASRADLRGVLTGLPVAGFSGTLVHRPGEPAESTGFVRAKTGTLLGVNALAGVAYDANGRLLVFAVLADRVPDPEEAEDGLDAIAAALAACGCDH